MIYIFLGRIPDLGLESCNVRRRLQRSVIYRIYNVIPSRILYSRREGMKAAGLMPGWLSKRVVISLLFFTIALTVFPFFYVNYQAGNPCQYVLGTDGCVSGMNYVKNSASGSSVLWKNRLAFSKEHVQLQGDKGTSSKLRNAWTTKQWKQKVDGFSALFQTLMKKNMLKPGWKALCIGAGEGQPVMALRENGVQDAIGMDKVPFPPLVIYGDIQKQPFPDDMFDFEYSDVFDLVQSPVYFLSEIGRTLKPGGIAVLHVSCDITDKLNDFTSSSCNRGHLRKLLDTITGLHVEGLERVGRHVEVVLKKAHNSVAVSLPKNTFTLDEWQASRNCSVSHQKLQAIANAEPLIVDEPRKPWITLKQNIKNIVYLPSMIDISHHRRHVYVDVGARNYGSSIGGWFKKRYPKQNQTFKIFAIEADTSFESGYSNRKDVTLLPYAAWIRNESLIFGDSRTGDPSFEGAGMGRIQPVVQTTGNVEDGKSSNNSKETRHPFKSVQGMDFSGWLLRTVSPHDYTVMKMDIEGTEFDLLPRMFDSGAICLVDELFLECHYNRWQRCCPERTRKYEKTYSDCLQLFETLRTRGVLVHQWW